MNPMKSFALIFYLIATFLSPIALAQNQDRKIPISVSHTGDDSVGKQFSYSVREAIRASNGYRLTGAKESSIRVSIVTIDPERSTSSNSYWTAAAITYTMKNFIPFDRGNPQTWYPIYLNTQVMTIGSQRINEQARAVMATIDEQLDQYRRESQE